MPNEKEVKEPIVPVLAEPTVIERVVPQYVEKVPTMKSRYLLPSGNAQDFFLYVSTTPQEMENMVDNALLFDEIALSRGLLSANQRAGELAVQGAAVSALKEQFGVRPENEVFHCVSIDIEPKAEGKSKVSFYGDGHRQPRDDYATSSLLLLKEDLQAALAPYYKFKLETFEKFGTFAVDFYVETYKSTKLNRVGNPYTNVARGGIKAVDGAAQPAPMKTPPPPESKNPEMPMPPTDGTFDDIPF